MMKIKEAVMGILGWIVMIILLIIFLPILLILLLPPLRPILKLILAMGSDPDWEKRQEWMKHAD